MHIKVSVILPVYNAEAYLPRCIASLLQQTLQNCEFIFVNDGSTDGSAAIIGSYAEKDQRIRLLEQPNGGVSAARNRGLDEARGEYIGFVDADDYASTDMFETLYKAAKAEDCDIVVSNIESEMGGQLVVTTYPFPVDVVLDQRFIKQQVLPFYLKGEEMNTACNKLYHATLLKRHAIRFPQNVALGEDGLFNMQAFSFAKSMRYIDYTGYRYCEIAGSATRDLKGKDYFGRALEVYHSGLPSIYEELMNSEEIKKLKSIKLIHSLLSNIHIYFASETLPLQVKLDYVRGMLAHREVEEALPHYIEEQKPIIGQYQKAMLRFIHHRSLWGLFLLTSYSRIRNRKNGGKRHENFNVRS